MDAVGGNLPDALALFDWNGRAGSSLIQTIGMVELIVRNSLDEQLVLWANSRGWDSWLDCIPLDTRGVADIENARLRAQNRGIKPVDHYSVISQLSFGFWRYLVAPRYFASLWVPQLHLAFHLGDTDLHARRIAVEERLNRLHIARNYAAHHQPVHGRNLLRDLGAAVDIASWISPDAGPWVAARSMIPQVVAEKPSEVKL